MADFIQGLKRRFSSNSGYNINKAPTVNSSNTEDSGLKGILISICSVLFVILIIAIIVHYTIFPIFKIGGKGFIPVPGILTNDGNLYWATSDHSELDEKDTILVGDKGDTSYTVMMDMYFDDLKAGSGSSNDERPIFMRYSAISDGTKPVNYSLGMFLDRSLNDLLVKVRTTKDTEVIKIKNIPSKTPIRVGAIVTKSYFEVYYNSRLIGTRNLKNPPIGSVGKIFGNPGTMPGFPAQAEQPQSNTGIVLDSMIDECKLGPSRSGDLGTIINLHIWAYALRSDAAKNTTPAMPKVTDFVKG